MVRFWGLGLAVGLVLSNWTTQEASASVAGKTYTTTNYLSDQPPEELTFSTDLIEYEDEGHADTTIFLTGDGLYGAWSETVGYFGRLSRFQAAASIDGTGDLDTLHIYSGIQIGTYLIGGAYSEAYKENEDDLGIILFIGTETASEE